MAEPYRAEKCSICHHDSTGQIDADLISSGMSVPRIAQKWNVGERSLYRHKNEHLPRRIRDAAALAEVEALNPEQLVARVVAIEQRALDLVDAAESMGDLRERAAAVRELRATVELLAKLSYSAADAPRVETSADADLDARLEAMLEASLLRECPACGANLSERVGRSAAPAAPLALEAGDVVEAEVVEG